MFVVLFKINLIASLMCLVVSAFLSFDLLQFHESNTVYQGPRISVGLFLWWLLVTFLQQIDKASSVINLRIKMIDVWSKTTILFKSQTNSNNLKIGQWKMKQWMNSMSGVWSASRERFLVKRPAYSSLAWKFDIT